MSTNKLIKFRPLANKHDFDRAKEIIETGEFWCSKLWNLNDSMEGGYKISLSNRKSISSMFENKNKAVICSFSHPNALDNPLLWGYYANGYKGIAIEIDCRNQSGIQKVCCDKDEINYDRGLNEIITNKQKCWAHEEEYRYINSESDKEGLHKIGEIKKVYFGCPYGTFDNREQITNNSKTLREYNYWKNELKLICDLNPRIKTNIQKTDGIDNINRCATRRMNGN